MLEFILIIGSLIASAGAGWMFLQYRSSSKKEKIKELAKKLTDKDIKVEKVSDLTNIDTEITTAINGIEEDTEDEKEKEKLAQAKELKELVESIKKEEDLNSKSYGYLDIGLAVGISLISLLILNWVIKQVTNVVSSRE